MPKIKIERIIDANLNRLKEGLRVCEEVARFLLNNHSLTAEFKLIRHKIDLVVQKLPAVNYLIAQRDSLQDTGRQINLKSEFSRLGYRDIFLANIQRVKESLRVLEEFSKLKNIPAAMGFKKIRYQIYALEKKVVRKMKLK